MKLKKGDTVSVVSGKDKGKTGKILEVFPKENKVLVEGANQYKRHLKGRVAGQKSEIVTLTKPLSVSNVSLICPNCKKLTRVGYEESKNKKIRVCKICKKEID